MINEKASLVQIPSGYKSGTLYSVVPNTSAGDFTVTRGSTATRVNKDGLIESVAANVPRLNYDPTNPQDPHLLLEPERTNIAENSNELNTGWAHSNCTLTPNQAVAPDGSNTGSFVERTSTVQARVERGINLTDQNYTWSCFVKKGNQRYAFISVFLVTSAVSVDTIFDFDTESIVFSSSAVIANSVVEYSNGWYRLTTTFDALASQTAFVKVGSTSSTTVFSTGNVGDTIYVWGAQLEVGSYPTSYIPTTIAVTRTVDTCEKSSVAAGIIGQTEGVIFLDFENYGQIGTSYSGYFKIQSNGNNDRVTIQGDGSTLNRLILVVNDGSSTFFQPRTIIPSGRNKVAIRYKSGLVASFINGAKIDTSVTSFSFSNTLNTIQLQQPNKVYQAMVFNEALTDSELITLTT